MVAVFGKVQNSISVDIGLSEALLRRTYRQLKEENSVNAAPRRNLDPRLLLLVGLTMVTSAGCNDQRQGLVPVAGQVLIDGQPLSKGVIRFAPEGGRGSAGTINSDGRFTLGSYEAADGALVGVHKIMIVAREQITDTTAKWHAPKQYASFQTSGLTAEITEPTDGLKIELTWGDQKGPFIDNE